jgi:hypothetical protein
MPLLEAEVRTINVHALGQSGSGKTVFMAAMYPQLRIKRGEADFYLKTDHATSVHMNSVFNAVSNPQEECSASTRVASEWEFGLTVLTPADDFGPLKIRYLDYPGLILTAPRPPWRPPIFRLRRVRAPSRSYGPSDQAGHLADRKLST